MLQQPILCDSLAWLHECAATAEFGDYPLGELNWYVNVHGYETLPERECCWENHRQTIDIQYLISGSEGIRWTDVSQFGKADRYIENVDREEYAIPADAGSLLVMQAGMFAIFLPGEVHCPKIALKGTATLRKAVVKIPIQLLGAGV